MGPAEFLIGNGIDVRPHPHIGLATVTYLFEGEIMHRDSLGTPLAIKPGEVNLMTAGRGIVHSERDGAARRKPGAARLFGIQAWAALPKIARGGGAGVRPPRRRRAAAHRRRGQARAPRHGQRLRRSARRSTSRIASFYAEAVLAPGAVLPLDPDYDERAIYVASGEIDIAGDTFAAGPAAGLQARRPHLDPGHRAVAPHAARRRADGRPAAHLVELRLVLEGAHRAGQGGLARASASRSCRATTKSSFRCRSEADRGRRSEGVGAGEAWSSGGSSRVRSV